MKVFLMLFPQIFTVYLIHGLIFWALGSTICVYLATKGLPYWSVTLIAAIVFYTTLFASLPILTPVVETLGKYVTARISGEWHIRSLRREDERFSRSPTFTCLVMRRRKWWIQIVMVRRKVDKVL
jgi:hypothetical protein